MSVHRLLIARLVGSVMLGAVTAACASEGVAGPASGLRHSAASPMCGPADGSAVAIYLAAAPVASLEPPAPFVRIHIWQPLERLRGRSWSLVPDKGEGDASFSPTSGEFESATRGTVTVTAVAADRTIEGWVDVTFPSAGRVRRGFRAAWLAPRSPLLCG